MKPIESTSTSEYLDLFLKSEVRKAKSITKSTRERRGDITVHQAIMELLRGDPIQRINAATQQDNNLSYMAYRLKHIADIATFEDLK